MDTISNNPNMFKKIGSSEGEGEGDNECLAEIQRLTLAPTVKKKLLVLSLGGLLCYRACIKRPSSLVKSRIPDASYGSIRVYKRPYSEDFLKFCLERFEVAVWSSAREWNLDNALDCVMGPLRRKLLFSWDQSHCTKSGFNTLENKNKPIFFKELNKIWVKYDEFSSSNTLLIDDEPYKALLNPPNTALFLDEYDGGNHEDNALGPGGQLRMYLDGLAKAEEEVGAYVKKYPLGNAAMTPNHPDWAYYSMVMNSHATK